MRVLLKIDSVSDAGITWRYFVEKDVPRGAVPTEARSSLQAWLDKDWRIVSATDTTTLLELDDHKKWLGPA